MELLEGCTLADEIKKGPLAPELVARYGAQIASALAEAHAHGIVHRDLKPANTMISRHGVKVQGSAAFRGLYRDEAGTIRPNQAGLPGGEHGYCLWCHFYRPRRSFQDRRLPGWRVVPKYSIVSAEPALLSREVLGWLDKYLGLVN